MSNYQYETLLDPITVEDLILTVRCNVPNHEINQDTVGRELNSLLEMRLNDLREVLAIQISDVIEDCRKVY